MRVITLSGFLKLHPWLTADVTSGSDINEVAVGQLTVLSRTHNGFCCSDHDAVLVHENRGIGSILIASAPSMRIAVLSTSFGPMKNYLRSRGE